MEELAALPTIANSLHKELALLLLPLSFTPRAGGSRGRVTSSARSTSRDFVLVALHLSLEQLPFFTKLTQNPHSVQEQMEHHSQLALRCGHGS